MKILFLPKWYPDAKDRQFGVFIQKHAKAVSLYAKVAVLYVAPSQNISGEDRFIYSEENGFPELIVYYQSSKTKNLFEKLRQFARYLIASIEGYRLIKKKFGKPDLHHVNIMARAGILPFVLSKTNRIPYVITEQWSGYSYGDFQKKNWLDRWVCKLIGNHSQGIIAVSTALEKKMKECGFKCRFFIIPNIVENVKLPPVVKKSGNKVKMLNISDMDDSKKNISGIIEAFAIFGKENKDVELHIIGGGDDEKLIKDLVFSKTGVKERIFLYGRQNNDFVYDLMPKIDFLITNSFFETFSVATVEALINGKPVIVSKCGGPEDFVTPEVGILYNTNDVDELVKAMREMSASYKNYIPKELSDYANKLFSYEAVGKKIINVYKTIYSKC